MKKIVMVLLIVGTAMFSQAANVNWSVLNLFTPSAGMLSPGTTGGGARMTTAEAANLVISVFWKNGENWETITPIDGKTTLTGAGVKASGGLWSQADAVTNRDASGNAYFKIVFEYRDATGTYQLTKESGAVSLVNITSQAKTVTFNMNNATWTYTPTGGGDVPEPTSGILLLVGGAMLALRRKQK